MSDLNQLKARLLTGNRADTDAVLALAAGHGIPLNDLLGESFLKERLDRWFETGEHIDSMFEDDHLFTHFFGSDGRFEMKIQGFSYYTSDLTSERTLLGRWRLAGMTPACFVLQLTRTTRRKASSFLFPRQRARKCTVFTRICTAR